MGERFEVGERVMICGGDDRHDIVTGAGTADALGQFYYISDGSTRYFPAKWDARVAPAPKPGQRWSNGAGTVEVRDSGERLLDIIDTPSVGAQSVRAVQLDVVDAARWLLDNGYAHVEQKATGVDGLRVGMRVSEEGFRLGTVRDIDSHHVGIEWDNPVSRHMYTKTRAQFEIRSGSWRILHDDKPATSQQIDAMTSNDDGMRHGITQLIRLDGGGYAVLSANYFNLLDQAAMADVWSHQSRCDAPAAPAIEAPSQLPALCALLGTVAAIGATPPDRETSRRYVDMALSASPLRFDRFAARVVLADATEMYALSPAVIGALVDAMAAWEQLRADMPRRFKHLEPWQFDRCWSETVSMCVLWDERAARLYERARSL